MGQDTVHGRIKSSIVFLAIIVITLASPKLFILHKLFFLGCGIIAILEIYLAYRSPSRIHTIREREIRMAMISEVIIISGGTISYLTFMREQVMLIQLGVIVCDTFAYITGKLFGHKFIRAKPFPEISPRKSYEGLIGGIACSTISVLGFSLWQSQHGAVTFLNFLAITFIGGLTVLGDLLGSLTKRRLSIKDSNACAHDHWLLQYPERLMSGFGGFLDRLDSIFFVSFTLGIIYSLAT